LFAGCAPRITVSALEHILSERLHSFVMCMYRDVVDGERKSVFVEVQVVHG